MRLAVTRGHSVVNVDALTYAACLDNVAEVGSLLHAGNFVRTLTERQGM